MNQPKKSAGIIIVGLTVCAATVFAITPRPGGGNGSGKPPRSGTNAPPVISTNAPPLDGTNTPPPLPPEGCTNNPPPLTDTNTLPPLPPPPPRETNSVPVKK